MKINYLLSFIFALAFTEAAIAASASASDVDVAVALAKAKACYKAPVKEDPFAKKNEDITAKVTERIRKRKSQTITPVQYIQTPQPVFQPVMMPPPMMLRPMMPPPMPMMPMFGGGGGFFRGGGCGRGG